MKSIWKLTLRVSLYLLILLAGSFTTFAQRQTSQDSLAAPIPSMHLPTLDKQQKFRASIGLSMVKPPKDMVETAIQAPLFNLHAMWKLPWRLSLEGDFSSLIVSNQISIGPRIGFGKNNLGMKIGLDIAYVAGRLKQFGFDNTTKAWIDYPNISGSYQWKQMAFTLKGEVIIVSSVTTKTGENQLSSNTNFHNGYSGAFYIEQRLHQNKVFIIGFKDSYVKYYWPTWMTFSTFNRFYHVPELSFSWIF